MMYLDEINLTLFPSIYILLFPRVMKEVFNEFDGCRKRCENDACFFAWSEEGKFFIYRNIYIYIYLYILY